MITAASNEKGKRAPREFFGKSTDEKPIGKFNDIKINNGSVFVEMDTKKIFMYDEEGQVWLEQ